MIPINKNIQYHAKNGAISSLKHDKTSLTRDQQPQAINPETSHSGLYGMGKEGLPDLTQEMLRVEQDIKMLNNQINNPATNLRTAPGFLDSEFKYDKLHYRKDSTLT